MSNVIKKYQHGGLNSKINPMLRGFSQKTNKYNKNIKNLNNLMKPGSTVNLYRGIHLSRLPHVLQNKAFTSASKNYNIAKTFGDVVISFTLPIHIKRHHIQNSHNYEFETLIQRGTQFSNFKLLRINKNGTKVYSAKINLIPPPPPVKTPRQLNSNNESSNFNN